jgi:hypothetical protein
MSQASNIERSKLKIIGAVQYENFEYDSLNKCNYVEWRHPYGQDKGNEYLLSVSIKPLKQNYQVLIERPGLGISSVYMDPKGKLFDFNLVNPIDGTRVTKETYQERIAKDKSVLGDKYVPQKIHFINPFSIFMPEFIQQNEVRPNQIVSILKEENGNVWGNYVYRGVSTYNNRQVLVLDLRRTINMGPDDEPLLFGFNLLDITTKLPVFTMFDAGTKVIFENVSCDR